MNHASINQQAGTRFPQSRNRKSALIAIALSILLLVFCWYFADVLLVTFAGILLALAFRGIAEKVSAHSTLSMNWALASVIGLSLIISVLAVLFLGPAFANGIDKLVSDLPAAVERIGQSLEQYSQIEKLLEPLLESAEPSAFAPQMFSRMSGMFSTAMGVFANFVGGIFNIFVILVVGVYCAIDPKPYVNSIVKLTPRPRRPRVQEVLQDIGSDLQRWLLGRVLSMAVVGVLTWLGLLLLGLPNALTLALVAALLSFIPNIGPVLALIPAVLTGFVESAATALYVLAMYVGVQLIESYAVTPLINQRVVTLPPAFVIIAQLLMGFAFGFLGLMFATPLAVMIRDAVQKLYIEDVLERNADKPNAAAADYPMEDANADLRSSNV